MMKDWSFILVLAGIIFAGVLLLFAPLAFADEPEQASSSSSSASNDYAEVLESIESKLEGLATSEDVATLAAKVDDVAKSEDVNGLSTLLEALRPVDNATRFDALNKFMGAIESVSLFQWVTMLLLVGVCLAIVFLIAYRSHT